MLLFRQKKNGEKNGDLDDGGKDDEGMDDGGRDDGDMANQLWLWDSFIDIILPANQHAEMTRSVYCHSSHNHMFSSSATENYEMLL